MSAVPAAVAHPFGDDPFVKPLFFDALFARELKPQGAFAEALEAAGYDPAHPQTEYRASVMDACGLLAERFVYPDLPEGEARQAVGRRMFQGYARTLVGRVVVGSLPLIGPTRFLSRASGHVISFGAPMQLTSAPVGERSGRFDVLHHPTIRPHFIAGVVEEFFRAMKVEPRVRIEVHGPARFSLHVDW